VDYGDVEVNGGLYCSEGKVNGGLYCSEGKVNGGLYCSEGEVNSEWWIRVEGKGYI
jgi:hypothetical protein